MLRPWLGSMMEKMKGSKMNIEWARRKMRAVFELEHLAQSGADEGAALDKIAEVKKEMSRFGWEINGRDVVKASKQQR